MATSPIYNWPEPDNTDLVKNGALAIRTLGDAIDTTMATMIPKSLIAAKGDLVAASANDTPAILSVGNSGETIVADSSTSTGLRWNPNVYGGKNFLINGGFDFWQRSTSSASSGGYFTADRWYQVASGTTTHSQDTDVPTGIGTRYSIKWVTGAATSYGQWYQPMESALVEALRGQTMTASVYVKTSSYGSGSLVWQADYKTTSDAFAGGGWSNITSTVITPPTGWTRYSITFTVPSNAVGMRIALVPDAVQGSGVTVKMTGAMLEVGSVPTSFSRAGGTIQGELAACQRYYYRTTTGVNNQLIGAGIATAATTASVYVVPPVTMRVAPTSVDAANLATSDLTAFTNAVTAPTTIAFSSVNNVRIDLAGGSGMTVKTPIVLQTNGTSGYLGLSAEL